MEDPVSICTSIIQTYQLLKERFDVMVETEKGWLDLKTEVLSYENLILEKLEVLKVKTKDEIAMDPHLGPIQIFHEAIDGLCNMLEPLVKSKGLLKRTFEFLRNFCGAPENAKRLKEYASKISHAAALLTFSGTVELE